MAQATPTPAESSSNIGVGISSSEGGSGQNKGANEQPQQRKRSIENLLFTYFKLLGQLFAKAILDGRLIDLPLHPVFWSFVTSPVAQWPSLVTEPALAMVDPALYRQVCKLRDIKEAGEHDLEQLSISFVLPGKKEKKRRESKSLVLFLRVGLALFFI